MAKLKTAEAEQPKTLGFTPTEGDDLSGFQQITRDTLSIPFVRILQKLSPQLDKQKPEYVEGAEEGMFYNTITRTVYGPHLRVVVGSFERVFIEWRPNRGGLVGYHTPENAERIAADKTFGKWTTEDGNLLQENYVYMVLIEGHEEEGVCVLSLASSMIKVARAWNRLMTTHIMPGGAKALPYYLVWDVKSEYAKNDKGTWYKPNITFAGYVSEMQYTKIKGERKALPSKTVDYKQLEQGEAEGAEGAPQGEIEF